MGFSKNQKAKSIKDIIEEMAGNSAVSSIALMKIIDDAWKASVGEFISENTSIKKFSHGTLFLHSDSAAIRSEIQMRKNTIITSINKELDKEIIENISFI